MRLDYAKREEMTISINGSAPEWACIKRRVPVPSIILNELDRLGYEVKQHVLCKQLYYQHVDWMRDLEPDIDIAIRKRPQ